MRFVLDTKEITQKVKDMKDDALTNARIAKENIKESSENKKRKIMKEDKGLQSLKDDIEYLELVATWNANRFLEGKSLYIPEGFSKGSIKMLKQEIDKRISSFGSQLPDDK